MDEVKQWLISLGMAEYLPLFAANHIEFEILRDLSDEDLKDIGIVSLGHRRRLMRAIAALPERAEGSRVQDRRLEVEAITPDHPPAANDGARREVGPTEAVERRNLSVMFVDLVGFEALAASLELEELGELVRDFQAEAARVIGVYDGVAAQCANDRVMALFGHPRAHEDDAERAVRAGLDLLAVAAKSDWPRASAVRIAVATGLAVVGDAEAGEAGAQRSVTGDAVNLAARLQGLAEPKTIVVSATTRQLLGGLFDFRDLGLHSVKGLPQPARAFMVLGASASRSRFEAHGGGSRVLVGRSEEREHLLTRRRAAWQRRGQTVLISGESGIGKSRLSEWLSNECRGQPHFRLRCQCTPHHRNTALYPVVNELERIAGFAVADTAEQKLAKLEKALAASGLSPASVVPLFAALMMVPLDERYPPLPSSPQRLRQRTIEAVLAQVEGLAGKRPVLFLCEDAQWADSASLEVLDLLTERIARLPVMIVITARPEFSPAWAGRHNVSVLTLQRLDRRQARAVVDGVTTGVRLPAEVLEQILGKTDGIPLFVEELTKTVLESGLLVAAGDEYRLTGPLPPLAIPATLQDSLMARLDRSNLVREIAQVGAAIGREFAYQLLVRVADLGETAVLEGLAKLEQAQLASRRGTPPEATYTFKHALVQEAAYESLLKSRRQRIHGRIANTLRDEFPIVAETSPETVARHFTLAGCREDAIAWWTRAGELALRRSANADAIAHLESAIALADGLPADPARHLSRFRLQVAYANAQLAMHGYTGRATVAAFAKCVALGESVEDVVERFSGFYGMWAASFASGEAMRSRKLIEAFVDGVGPLADGQETVVGHRMLGLSHWCTGDYKGALVHLEAALAAYDPDRDFSLTFRFGQDLGLSTMIKMAVTAWPAGRVDFARGLIENAMERARTIGHMQTLAYACCYKACFEAIRDDPARAAPDALATLSIGREHDLSAFWVGLATALRGWTRWRAGDHDPGAAEMREGLVVLRNEGVGLYQPLCDALWAEVEADKDLDAAIQCLDRALALTQRSKQVWFDAELHRRQGLMLLESGRTDEGEAALRRSLAVARKQGTHTFGLRAALALARLYRRTGRMRLIEDMLPPILADFGATAELAEIAEARQLLALCDDVDAGFSP